MSPRVGRGFAWPAHAVVSHLRQDHIGGIGAIPGADLLVSDEEWRSLRRPLPEARGLLRAHIDLPDAGWAPVTHERIEDPALRPFTTGHDVFGDGSLTLLPTPGHTTGSMSLFVRPDDGPPLLLVGDLTYDVRAFERGVAGGVGSERLLRETRAKVMALAAHHATMPILAAHDPAAAGLLAAHTDERRVA